MPLGVMAKGLHPLLQSISPRSMMNTLYSNATRTDMLEGILSWLVNNITHFTPPKEDQQATQNPELISPDLSRKAHAELGLALRLAQRSKPLRQHPLLQRLKNMWTAVLDQQNFFFDIRRRLQLFPHRTIAAATLKSFGMENKQVRDELQTVLQQKYMDRVERSAWDKLDMKYYTEAAGLRNEFPSDQNLYAASTLHQLPSLAYVQNHDLYGITHLLFHFTDFGRHDLQTLAGSAKQDIQAYVDLALALCDLTDDYDLMAELLINQHCLNKPFNAIDRQIADNLQRTQQTAGFIPGRNWVSEQQTQPKQNPNDHQFEDVYHPTILGLILICCEYQMEA